MRALVIVAAAAAALAVSTASPTVAKPVDRASMSWPAADEVVATCEDGSQIGLGFDLTRNVHDRYDRSGVLVSQTRNVVYTGYFENLGTGERHSFRGTRVVTSDFVDGTFTSRGAYRVVTMAGEGAVFLAAGRYVEDLDVEGLFYASSGPKLDEFSEGGQEITCALFGLRAAS